MSLFNKLACVKNAAFAEEVVVKISLYYCKHKKEKLQQELKYLQLENPSGVDAAIVISIITNRLGVNVAFDNYSRYKNSQALKDTIESVKLTLEYYENIIKLADKHK